MTDEIKPSPCFFVSIVFGAVIDGLSGRSKESAYSKLRRRYLQIVEYSYGRPSGECDYNMSRMEIGRLGGRKNPSTRQSTAYYLTFIVTSSVGLEIIVFKKPQKAWHPDEMIPTFESPVEIQYLKNVREPQTLIGGGGLSGSSSPSSESSAAVPLTRMSSLLAAAASRFFISWEKGSTKEEKRSRGTFEIE